MSETPDALTEFDALYLTFKASGPPLYWYRAFLESAAMTQVINLAKPRDKRLEKRISNLRTKGRSADGRAGAVRVSLG